MCVCRRPVGTMLCLHAHAHHLLNVPKSNAQNGSSRPKWMDLVWHQIPQAQLEELIRPSLVAIVQGRQKAWKQAHAAMTDTNSQHKIREFVQRVARALVNMTAALTGLTENMKQLMFEERGQLGGHAKVKPIGGKNTGSGNLGSPLEPVRRLWRRSQHCSLMTRIEPIL
jgi:hypothetical protein